jgi:hypothetical protein
VKDTAPLNLRPNEKAMLGELRQIDARVEHAEQEVTRAGNPTHLHQRRTQSTAEGAAKSELVFNLDQLTANAVKLAAHNGSSWELINDWPAFQSYCGTPLYRQIIDVENNELLPCGTGSWAGGMVGFIGTSGILTHNASGDVSETFSTPARRHWRGVP